MARIPKEQYEKQKEWESKIHRAKKVREDWKKLFKVDLAKDYFDGKQNPGYPNEEWITINKVYSHIQSQLPTLYSNDPYVYVKLKKSYSPDPLMIALYDQKGKTRSGMLNYMKDELGLKPKTRLAIQDAMFAYGVVKVFFSNEMKENPDAGRPIFDEDGDMPLIDDQGQPLIEPEEIPINERYNIARIHPDDFLWDEDAGPLQDDWNWLAHRVRVPYSEALKDKRFSRKALSKLEGKGESLDDEQQAREDRKKGGDVRGRSETDTDGKKKGVPQKDQIVTYWEITHLKTNRWTVIAEGGEVPLVDNEPLPPGTEDHAFAILRFTLRDDSPYPIPPVSQMIDLCREKNLLRSRMVTHRKRFNRKYEVFDMGLSDETEASKLESGEDGTFIRKKTPEQVVYPIQDAPLDQQTTVIENSMIDRDLIEVGGGTTDEARGIAGADSATQAGIMDKRLEIKEGDRISIVIDFVVDIFRKLDMLVQAHITRDEAVKVTGPQGEYWQLVKASDYDQIEGEYEYSVNVGSTLPRLPEVERNSWLAFMGLLASFPHLLLSKRFIRKMAELHHLDDEAMIDELIGIGKQIMAGQMPMPGGVGSQPGVGETRPVSAVGGQQGGMMAAMGGNNGM